MSESSANRQTDMPERMIPNTNQITQYLHCGQCIDERPEDQSPADWQQLEVGFTPLGVQVWCKRHQVNILHVDFQGIRHPANTTRRKRHGWTP